MPSDSICAAVTDTQAPVVIAVSGQSVAFNGITVPIPGQAVLNEIDKSDVMDAVVSIVIGLTKPAVCSEEGTSHAATSQSVAI